MDGSSSSSSSKIGSQHTSATAVTHVDPRWSYHSNQPSPSRMSQLGSSQRPCGPIIHSHPATHSPTIRSSIRHSTAQDSFQLDHHTHTSNRSLAPKESVMWSAKTDLPLPRSILSICAYLHLSVDPSQVRIRVPPGPASDHTRPPARPQVPPPHSPLTCC